MYVNYKHLRSIFQGEEALRPLLRQVIVENINKFSVCWFLPEIITGDVNKQLPVALIPAVRNGRADTVIYIVPGCVKMCSHVCIKRFVDGEQILIV